MIIRLTLQDVSAYMKNVRAQTGQKDHQREKKGRQLQTIIFLAWHSHRKYDLTAATFAYTGPSQDWACQQACAHSVGTPGSIPPW